jgi:cobalamin-dependent methionine synthase I
LLALLRADEIGITLSEEDQLDPEQSTSAIVRRRSTSPCEISTQLPCGGEKAG